MQGQETNTQQATEDEKIAHVARTWRRLDKAAIADKSRTTREAEYHGRQQLRRVIDDASSP